MNGAYVDLSLKDEQLVLDNIVICEKTIRRSSKENPFNVSGACDICGEEKPRMNLATYKFPNDRNCDCCNGSPHSFIIKFCNECKPPHVRQVYAVRLEMEKAAKKKLVQIHHKDFKRLLASEHAKFSTVLGEVSLIPKPSLSQSRGLYLDEEMKVE